MNYAELYNKYLECTSVSTDTRNIGKDSMFFALKGERFNANEFAEEALSKGAKYVVIDEEKYKKNERYILTDDVLTALQGLANYHRRQLAIPVIGITGSNGKTTSKELIHAVLSTTFKTFATVGNLNNHIGIPLTLLAIKKGTEMAVVEMGANHQKEIEGYCKVAEPDFGIITNIGKAHLEGFGGIEGVKKGKGELYDYLQSKGGNIFLNTGNETLMGIAGNRFPAAIKYPNAGDYYHTELIDASPYVRLRAENGEVITTKLAGIYNYENIAAALCIAKFFKVPEALANKAIADYQPNNNRSQISKTSRNTLLLDAYNANPSSMKAAIENFSKMDAAKKMVILGDMFELGEESEMEHAGIGKLLMSQKFDSVLLVGNQMKHAAAAASQAVYFHEKKELEEYLKNGQFSGYTILIKGSRKMGLESLTSEL